MKIHEYQAKDLLRAAGVPVLAGRVARTPEEAAAAFTALGVPYHADQAQIKSAYRTMSQKYHPDKHTDLDPDIRALTAEKFAQIKAAYDTLCGIGGTSGDWYSKQADSGRLAPAVPDAVVLCFVCRQKVRLPPAEHLSSARCPHCQTLLAFERDLAEQLV